jgi:putative glycosyltransferase HI1698
MNIMFLFNTPINTSVGGVQRVTDVLSREFIKRGHSVVFVAYAYRYMLDGVSTVAPQYFIDIDNQTEEKNKYDLNRIISKNNIQIVVSQSLSNNRILKMISSKVRIISVCHVQPFLVDNWNRKNISAIMPKNLRQRAFKYISLIFPRFYIKYTIQKEVRDTLDAFKLSDYVCYVSNRFFYRVRKHVISIPEDKMIAINNPNSFAGSSINNKEKLIIWVGRINNQSKNTLDFVKMWSKFSPKNPDWRSQIIGYGRDFEEVKKYIERNGIRNIELVGRTNNVEYYYKRAQIVAVTSLSESWCLSITEGMSYGCIPCVYDTFETIRDMIIPNESGIIVSPTPEDMEEKLTVLCNDSDEIKRLSYNAINSIAKFSIDRIADEWISVFNNLLSSKEKYE